MVSYESIICYDRVNLTIFIFNHKIHLTDLTILKFDRTRNC